MPTQKRTTRRYIALPPELWREIEEYRDREHVLTTADAVRRLLQAGLKAEQKPGKAAKK